MSIKIISKNRKAFHEYEILEKFEAGISLWGTEVKALREAKVNLGDGWVDLRSNGAFLCDVHIGHYTFGNIENHEEKRRRPLLLHKKEMDALYTKTVEKGMAVVPLAIYFKGDYVKVEIATARGKKAHDKRESSKEKDAKRDIARAFKKNQRD